MKKLILISILFFSINSNSQTVLDVLNAMTGNSNNNTTQVQKVLYKEVMNEVVNVNSTSKARLSGGNTRQGLKVRLPFGTTKWYYRVTLMNINWNYTYQPRETLISLLSNNDPLFVNNQTDFGIDFYVLDDFSINNFSQTGNNNFKYYQDFTRLRTRGFYGECNLTQDNLWIGIKNNDISQGLKVIVEVVAFGNFN